MQDRIWQFREYMRLERKRTSDGLTLAELPRWEDLKRKLSKASGKYADRRASVRVRTRLRVSFQTTGELQQSLMTSLSRGGVFVSTAFPAEIGTGLVLRIRIEESGELLEIPGEVVSVNISAGLSTSSMGMGVRFGELSPDVRKQIDDLYEQQLERAVTGSQR